MTIKIDFTLANHIFYKTLEAEKRMGTDLTIALKLVNKKTPHQNLKNYYLKRG